MAEEIGGSKALKLLQEYRTVLWRKSALESVSSAGAKALGACNSQVLFTQRLVEMLKNHHTLGEKRHLIISETYMTHKQPLDVDEILSSIADKQGSISRSGYYKQRQQAIDYLDRQLEKMSNENLADCRQNVDSYAFDLRLHSHDGRIIGAHRQTNNIRRLDEMENLLPLGSIVILKDGEKKLMIYGRLQLAADTNEHFDYVGCLWPEGNLNVEHTYLFNHSDVDTVAHYGYSDDEELAFMEVLAEQ